ncbi:MAG: agmatine deiminase [Lachnospiraceae bacterium]|nr:agmatine deiminase [Lachnospiraceae bacterium]
MIYRSFPKDDGFYMPAEFDTHEATIMIFPERPGSWPYEAKAARKVFSKIIAHISSSERIYVIVSDASEEAARKMLLDEPPCEIAAIENRKNIKLVNIDTDDAWARDTAPTFVRDASGSVRGINWKFNAWGGDFDGLYASWERDDALAVKFCEMEGYDYYDEHDFVLEGGSIHTDGAGTVLVTESCLLSKGRNPQMSKDEIEERLKNCLGAERVIWLPRGIYNDETNEHVDNVCAFIAKDEVVLAWTDDKNDPQYEMSESCLRVLEENGIKVHKLPVPDSLVCVGKEDLEGYIFEEGEDVREVGERLAASYVNFYFTNKAVLLPQFGGDNTESDKRAVRIMEKLCPDRTVIPISARDIILGGGNIHCITQQIPAGKR